MFVAPSLQRPGECGKRQSGVADKPQRLVISADLDRIDRIIEGSEVVADRVDAASKIAYSAVSRPVIKAMAVRAGTAEAVRKMRGR